MAWPKTEREDGQEQFLWLGLQPFVLLWDVDYSAYEIINAFSKIASFFSFSFLISNEKFY